MMRRNEIHDCRTKRYRKRRSVGGKGRMGWFMREERRNEELWTPIHFQDNLCMEIETGSTNEEKVGKGKKWLAPETQLKHCLTWGKNRKVVVLFCLCRKCFGFLLLLRLKEKETEHGTKSLTLNQLNFLVRRFENGNECNFVNIASFDFIFCSVDV